MTLIRQGEIETRVRHSEVVADEDLSGLDLSNIQVAGGMFEHVSFRGCRLGEVADVFGTPVYVVDEESLRNQARGYRRGLESRRAGSQVAFASKAFPCRAVYRLMAEEGLLVDVAGHGELLMARGAGPDSVG